ncbi:hypothetical protein TNCV_855601 [Trichonephila clavipes]|nr:hypothetical protein TNCV_855601 [Trichonephila clavipes]
MSKLASPSPNFHTNNKTWNVHRFNAHQPLYTTSLQWHPDSKQPQVEERKRFCINVAERFQVNANKYSGPSRENESLLTSADAFLFPVLIELLPRTLFFPPSRKKKKGFIIENGDYQTHEIRLVAEQLLVRERQRTDNNSGKTGVPIWLLLEEVDLESKAREKTSSNSAYFRLGAFL